MKITQVVDYKAGKQRISFIIGRVSATIRGEAKPVSDPLLGGLPDAGPSQAGPVLAEAPESGSALAAVPPPLPTEEPIVTGAGAGRGASAAAAPDLSLTASAGGTATLPPVVAAVAPPRTQQAAPDVRLVRPASVGRGLRNDDISGFYLGVGGLAALLTLAAFLLRGGRRAT